MLRKMYTGVPGECDWETWKKEVATDASASAGHSRNQSIVQQLTSAGNMRNRCLHHMLFTVTKKL